MPTPKRHASTILGAFEQARTELIGKAVILTDGKAGTVENVWLDEFHGLRICRLSSAGRPLSHGSRVCVRLVTPCAGSKQSARS